MIDSVLQIVTPDPALCDRLSQDANKLVPNEAEVTRAPEGASYVDKSGREFRSGGGFYNQIACPLYDAARDELAGLSFPDVAAPARVTSLEQRARSLFDGDYGLVADGPLGLYQVVSDEQGSQRGLPFAPRHFRSLHEPRIERLVSHVRSLTEAKTYPHSDGAIADPISQLNEIGIDGLNRVQYTGEGTDTAPLNEKCGKDPGRVGGDVTSEVLASGTRADIQREVRRKVTALAPGEGIRVRVDSQYVV